MSNKMSKREMKMINAAIEISKYHPGGKTSSELFELALKYWDVKNETYPWKAEAKTPLNTFHSRLSKYLKRDDAKLKWAETIKKKNKKILLKNPGRTTLVSPPQRTANVPPVTVTPIIKDKNEKKLKAIHLSPVQLAKAMCHDSQEIERWLHSDEPHKRIDRMVEQLAVIPKSKRYKRCTNFYCRCNGNGIEIKVKKTKEKGGGEFIGCTSYKGELR